MATFAREISLGELSVVDKPPIRLVPPAGGLDHGPPKTKQLDPSELPVDAPKTHHVPEAELSGIHKTGVTVPASTTAPTNPAREPRPLPYAEAVADARPAHPEESERVNFDFPEAEGEVLRPTLVIGVGGFGLLALRELRSRLTDCMGDLQHVPAVRFLYLDADPQATVGTSGSPDRALNREQVFPTPLQPVAVSGAALDLLSEWLPREKLHAIPRNMHPQGSRALGRLAFTENYLRFVTRVRRELEIASHPESIARSADHLRPGGPRHPAAGVRPRRRRGRVVRGPPGHRVRGHQAARPAQAPPLSPPSSSPPPRPTRPRRPRRAPTSTPR